MFHQYSFVTSLAIIISATLALNFMAHRHINEQHEARRNARWHRWQDPFSDAPLKILIQGLDLTHTQVQGISQRFARLRQEQRELLESFFRRGGFGRGRGQGNDRQNDGPPPFEVVKSELMPLAESFLADCQLMLNQTQMDSWRQVINAIDFNPRLMPPRRGDDWMPLDDTRRGVQINDPAPLISLNDIDGETYSFDRLSDKPIVLWFGSYTSPAFRKTALAMEKVREHLGGSVHWFLIYTYEACPSDDWADPDNIRDGIEIPAHADYHDRVAAARRMIDDLGLASTVLIDDADDLAARSYGGAPNRVYVIGRDGLVRYRQIWCEPQNLLPELQRLAST